VNIDIETPTKDIIANTAENRNGLMCALAGRVFGKADGRMLKAYTNFGFMKLALVIDAKRKGIFNYGAAIRQLDVGAYIFPTDTDAVLKAIELAAEEKYDEVDLDAMNLLDSDGNVVVPLKELFPAYTNGAGAAPTSDKKSSSKGSGPDNGSAVKALAEALPEINGMFSQKQIDKVIRESLGITRLYASRREAILSAGVEQELWTVDEKGSILSVKSDLPEVLEEPQQAEEPQPDPEPEQKAEEPQPAQSGPQETRASDAPDDLSAAALVRINKLASDIADAFDTLLEEVKGDTDVNRIKLAEDIQSLGEFVSTETERISNNQVHLLLYLQTIDKNMRAMLTYFVDPHFDFIEVPDAADFIRYIPEDDDDSDELPPEAGDEPQLQVIEGGDPGVNPVPHTVHDGSLQDCPECYAVRVANAAEEEEEQNEDPGPEPEEQVDPGFTVYTAEQLDGMGLEQLRKEGAKIGVAPARFDKTMRKRILAKYEELGVKP
jgi:hypothetical protein